MLDFHASPIEKWAPPCFNEGRENKIFLHIPTGMQVATSLSQIYL